MTSLSVIVPAFNEEGNIADTVNEIVPLLEKEFKDYEIILFNDGSSDSTGSVVDQLSAKNNKIKAVHNPRTRGLGYNYKKGVEMAAKDYVIMVPGDNDILKKSLEEMFKRIGEADIIIPYTGNMEIRPLVRRLLSRAFTALMNLLFGLNLKYFNGVVIHKRSLIQTVQIKTDSFAYQAEALIKLIKSGHDYIEVPQYIRERKHGKSKAFHLKNVLRIFKSIAQLFYEIRIKNR